jgi:hypothetical protein
VGRHSAAHALGARPSSRHQPRYVARKAAGRRRGYTIAGTLGGVLVPSTTLTLARLSQTERENGRALAAGTMGERRCFRTDRTAVLAPALTKPYGRRSWLSIVISLILVWRGLVTGNHAADR